MTIELAADGEVPARDCPGDRDTTLAAAAVTPALVHRYPRCRARRQAAGACPVARLNARLNAASDS
jgi:hypothetical protein